MSEKDRQKTTAERAAPSRGQTGRVAASGKNGAGGTAALPKRHTMLTRGLPLSVGVIAGIALGILGLQRIPMSLDGVGAGERQPASQETIRLGARAVLVAEAGSRVRWQPVGSSAVVVEQSAGEVFYRVNGGSFQVETPLGSVRVRGSCFRVDATNATGVVVTVQEGRVALERGGNSVELSPGQAGELPAEGPARRLESVASTPAPKTEEKAEEKAEEKTEEKAAPAPPAPVAAPEELQKAAVEAETLRARIAELEQELTRLRPAAQPAKKPGETRSGYLDPTQEELVARAERCEIRYDSPRFREVDQKEGRRRGLSESERAALNEALGEVKNHLTSELRRLHAEMSGDPAASEKLPAEAIQDEIFVRLTPNSRLQARRQLARERAGLNPPPADLAQTSIAERALRLLVGVGDLLERRLADRIGTVRARSLRARDGGWSGKTVQSGCE